MQAQEIRDILQGDIGNSPEGDHVFQGMLVMKRWLESTILIKDAESNPDGGGIIYALKIEQLAQSDITPAGIAQLRDMLWMLDTERDCLKHYV